MLTFPSAPNHVRYPPQGLGELRKSTVFLDARTQLTDFSQIPQILRARFRCMTSFTSPWSYYLGFLFWHLCMTHPARATWTPALMLQLTNPCAKRKVLSLTKPKGKIYKTKSLSHYIISGIRLSVTYLLSSTQAVWYKTNFTAVMFVFFHRVIFERLSHFLYSGTRTNKTLSWEKFLRLLFCLWSTLVLISSCLVSLSVKFIHIRNLVRVGPGCCL